MTSLHQAFYSVNTETRLMTSLHKAFFLLGQHGNEINDVITPGFLLGQHGNEINDVIAPDFFFYSVNTETRLMTSFLTRQRERGFYYHGYVQLKKTLELFPITIPVDKYHSLEARVIIIQ